MNNTCRVFAAIGVLFFAVATAAADQESVSDADKLKFDQEKVAANMRELEDRMLKLAGLLRDENPDDSARLLLGVESAREELILEQMVAVSELLASVDLSQATDEQKAILQKLQQLKQLLLNDDLDMRIKLEQLKKLEDAQRKLSELLAKEQLQKSSTEAAEGKSQELNPLVANEQRNQKAGENLEQQLGTIAGSGKASESIASASQSMGKAAESLQQGECDNACESQQQAIDKLKQAGEQLAELKEQLQEQVEAGARKRVSELLNEMIERQTSVKDGTTNAMSRFAEGDQSATELLIRLADVEQSVVSSASECIEICDLTEFSFVLPSALRDIRERMINVRSTLEQSEADPQLVPQQLQIIADLKQLVDAMQTAAKPGSPEISNSKCGRCNNRNKLIAEVKMLLFMQKAVSRKTEQIHQAQATGELAGELLEKESRKMKSRQDEIRDVTLRLRELTDPEFVNGDSL